MKQLTVEQVAELCHETNREYCAKIGDYSQRPWMTTPEWQKRSVIDGVRFRLKYPEVGPAASHENWVKYKSAEGWKYGPEKNETLKEHPAMLPFAELPPEQRAKDYLFSSVVLSLLENGMIKET